MLKITRSADSRVIKAILHRVADIPGGVTIKTSVLGGAALKEGTPIGPVAGDMYAVVKTAVLVADAANDATTYQVAKGHHFKVGDYLTEEGTAAQQITAIDKTTYTDKDVLTVGTTLGVAMDEGDVLIEGASSGTTSLVTPTAIAGSNYDVDASENLFVDAWIIAVVKEDNTVPLNTAIKTALKGIHLL